MNSKITSILISIGVVFCHAQINWEWSNPKPSGNDLIKVHFDDQNHGLIIADNGEVSESIDSGKTWKSQGGRIGDDEDYLYSSSVINRTTIVALSGFGKIWRSMDRGLTWSIVYSNPKTLLNIQTCGNGIVLAVGMQGTTIVRSQDNGLTWKEVVGNDDGPYLVGLHCSDNSFFAVGEEGAIFRSRNLGLNWDSIPFPMQQGLTSIAFSNSNHGIVTTNQGRLLETKDGGTSWKSVLLDSLTYLFSIQYQGRRWMVTGSTGGLWTSSDDGLTWNRSNTLTQLNLNSAAFIGEFSGIAIGDNGFISKESSAENWSTIRLGTDQFIDGVAMVTPSQWIAFGAPGSLLKTQNGGKSWRHIRMVPDSNRFVAGAFQKKYGLLTGLDGTLVLSQDEGETWREITTPYKNYRMFGVAWSDSSSATVVGDSGLLYRTRDFGKTWNRMPPANGMESQTLSAVGYLSNGTGIIVGYGGVILRSKDKGENWVLVPTGIEENLYAFSFRDSLTGLAVGENGVVLKSLDGGQSWKMFRLGFPGDYVFGISWLGGDTAIASGDWGHGGFLNLTTDAGESWSDIALPTRKMLWFMGGVGEGRAILAGQSGAILLGNLAHSQNGNTFHSSPEDQVGFISVQRMGRPDQIQIRLELATKQTVTLTGFSLSGQRIGIIFQGPLLAGKQTLQLPWKRKGPMLVKMEANAEGQKFLQSKLLRF